MQSETTLRDTLHSLMHLNRGRNDIKSAQNVTFTPKSQISHHGTPNYDPYDDLKLSTQGKCLPRYYMGDGPRDRLNICEV